MKIVIIGSGNLATHLSLALKTAGESSMPANWLGN